MNPTRAENSPFPIKAALARVSKSDLIDGGAIALDIEFKAGRQNVIILGRGPHVSAFINRCPHARWPLDTFDGRFLFTPNGEIMCAAHGAVFDPHTGACLGGPGIGEGLTQVDCVVREDVVEIFEG